MSHFLAATNLDTEVLEDSVRSGNLVSMRHLLEAGAKLTSNALYYFVNNRSQDSGLWELIVVNSNFHHCLGSLQDYLRLLKEAMLANNRAAISFLLWKSPIFTAEVLAFFASDCVSSDLWEVVVSHPCFEAFKNSPCSFLDIAITHKNIVAVEHLLKQRVDLTETALFELAKRCRNPVIWEAIVACPDFEVLINQKEFFKTLLQVSTFNSVAHQFLISQKTSLSLKDLMHLSHFLQNPMLWEQVISAPNFDDLKDQSIDDFSLLEHAINHQNRAAVNALLSKKVRLTTKTLECLAKNRTSHFYHGDLSKELWEKIISYPGFEEALTPEILSLAFLNNNCVALEVLMSTELFNSGFIFPLASLESAVRRCKTPGFWKKVPLCSNFPELRHSIVSNMSSSLLYWAMSAYNDAATAFLLEQRITLKKDNLVQLARKIRDPLVWEHIILCPGFEELKNQRSKITSSLVIDDLEDQDKMPLESAISNLNEVAFTYLLQNGAEFTVEFFSEYTICEKFPQASRINLFIAYVRNLESNKSSLAPEAQRMFRLNRAKISAMLLPQEGVKEVLCVSIPSMVQDLWLSFMNKNEGTPSTTLEQAWAFIALFRINPDELIARLSNSEGKAFMEQLSRDIFKKIKALASDNERQQMVLADILGNADFKPSLALLQLEDKNLSQIESYANAAIVLGNSWEDLSISHRLAIAERLNHLLDWARSMNATDLEDDIWIALGLLMLEPSDKSHFLSKIIGSKISEEDRDTIKRQTATLFLAAPPASSPDSAVTQP